MKTFAFKAPTFKHPANTTRTNSGGILSPPATFKTTARTDGRKHCTDYFAHNSSSLILLRLSAKWCLPTAENFIIVLQVRITKIIARIDSNNLTTCGKRITSICKSEKITFQGKSNKELITSQLVVRGLHPFVRVGKSHSKVNQTRNIWVHLGCT